MNGNWFLKNVEKKTNKTIRQSKVTFKDGKLIGSFSYDYNPYLLVSGYSFVSIKGKFSKEGNYDSTWVIKYSMGNNSNENEDIRKYKNGKLYWRLHRNLTTGEIFDRYDTLKYTAEPIFESGFAKNGTPLYLPDYVVEVWLNQKIDENDGNNDIWNSPLLSNLFNIVNKIEHNYLDESMPNKALFVEELKRKEKQKAYAIQQEEELKRNKAYEEMERVEKEKRDKEAEERRRKAKEAEEIRKAERTDYGQLEKAVKTEFSNWIKKGEFESEQDFQNRIKNSSTLELTKISDKAFGEFKKKQMTIRYGSLENYDGNSFALTTFIGYGKQKTNDSIHIQINRNIAQNFKENFSRAYYKDSQIFIYPQDFILMNNYWVISSAIIVFNYKYMNKEWSRGGNRMLISKLSDGKIVCSTRETTPELNNYRLKNIREVNKINDDLYYYEWNISEEKSYDASKIQNHSFTLVDLSIEAPLK